MSSETSSETLVSRQVDSQLLQRFWLVLPALVTLALTFTKLRVRQPWRDEHATWWAATIPLDDLWRLLGNVDAVFAPYYLLMRGWTSLFGSSSFALRVPSALAMSVAAAWLVMLGRRLFSLRVGVIAGGLFAILPTVSRYAQEARPYAFAVAACVGATLALVRAVEAPSPRRWGVYFMSLLFIGASHLFSLTVLGAHALWVLLGAQRRDQSRRAVWLGWSASVAASVLLLSPLLWLGATQRGQVSWIESVEFKGRLLSFPDALAGAPAVGGILVGLGLAALVRVDRYRWLLGGWILLPPALFILTEPYLHFFYYRYLLFTLPALVLLAAVTLDTMSPKSHALVALVMFFVGAFGIVRHQEMRLRVSREYDYRSAANIIKAKTEPGDGLVVPNRGTSHVRRGLAYEFRHAPDTHPEEVFVARSARAVGRFTPQLCEDDVAACLPANKKRLWLVNAARTKDIWGETKKPVVALLKRDFRVIKTHEVGEDGRRIRVALLERKAPSDAAHARP